MAGLFEKLVVLIKLRGYLRRIKKSHCGNIVKATTNLRKKWKKVLDFFRGLVIIIPVLVT